MPRYVLVALICLISLGSCSSDRERSAAAPATQEASAAEPRVAQQSPDAVAPGPLVSVTSSGGLCPEGPCRTSLVVAADGEWERTGTGGTRTSGRLADGEASELRELVAQADIAALTGTPFEGTCPSAMDGQEVTYGLRTGSGWVDLPSCTYALPQDAPLIRALSALSDRLR